MADAAAMLPASLQSIAKVIGEEATFGLVMELGGTMVYVPAQAKSDTLLVRAIGQEAAGKLGRMFGGTHLDLPKASKALTLWLDAKGLPHNEIARRLKISAHTVSRRVNGRKATANQLDLFKQMRS